MSNKAAYLELRDTLIGGGSDIKDVDFYFVHQASRPDNFMDILKDGVIKLVKDVPIENRVKTGPEDLEYVYGNVQYNDINNLLELGNYSILIHPQISHDQDWIFNTHWGKYPMSDSTFFYKTDDVETKDHKFSKIKKYVINPNFYEGTPLGKDTDLTKLGPLGHEILFTEPIDLNKYLIGVVYHGKKNDLKKVKTLLKKYPNAKMIKSPKECDGSMKVINLLIGGRKKNDLPLISSIDENYFIVHSTQNADNLLAVLKDGNLRPGKDLPKKRRIFSGGEPLEYIYGNIQFTDIKNLPYYGSIVLILNPKIIKDYGVIFNQGWFKSPTNTSIYVRKDDTEENKSKKIQEIKDYVANPTYYKNAPNPDIISAHMAHELLFDTPIPLKDNLIGVMCYGCPDKVLKKIKSVMKKKYPDSKIYTVNSEN